MSQIESYRKSSAESYDRMKAEGLYRHCACLWNRVHTKCAENLPIEPGSTRAAYLIESHMPKGCLGLFDSPSHYQFVLAEIKGGNQVAQVRRFSETSQGNPDTLHPLKLHLDETGAISWFQPASQYFFHEAGLKTADWRQGLNPRAIHLPWRLTNLYQEDPKLYQGPETIVAYTLPDPDHFPKLEDFVSGDLNMSQMEKSLGLLHHIGSTAINLMKTESELVCDPIQLPRLNHTYTEMGFYSLILPN